MTIARSITTSLLAVAVVLTACKKDADSKPPLDDGGGQVTNPEDNGGDASEAPSEDFLTVDAFEETITSKQGDVVDCYSAAKEAKPALAGGKLALEFTIDGQGKVSAIKPEPGGTIDDPGLTACVTDKAKGWQFPKTRDGNTMTLPYSFNLS